MTCELTRVEFQNMIHDIAGRVHISGGFGTKTKWEDRDVLEVKWVSGGVSGGNCWGDEANQPVYGEPMPEFDDLDNLLIEIVPDMGILHYKKLIQLITDDESCEYEYYGNSTIYAIKRIKVEDVWRFLCEHGFVEEVGGKKLYFCSRFKSPDAKRRKRWFVTATSEQKAYEKATIGAPDGWSGVVGLYNKDNDEMVKAFGKLTKMKQHEYEELCSNAR